MNQENNTTANTQEYLNTIATAVANLQAIHPATTTTYIKEYQFTKEELKQYSTMLLEKGAEAVLDDVRCMDLDESSEHVYMELSGNQIEVKVDMDAVADEIIDFQSAWEVADHMDRWYRECSK